MLRPISALFLAAALLLITSCEHADPFQEDGLQPTLESIQENIFNTSCAVSGCHLGASPPEGLDLSAGMAEANLIGVDSREKPEFKRVDPGNPDDSYLLMKIEGDSRIIGQRMPIGRPALPAEQISVIREWITDLDG